jgi:hypothetical protein
MTRRSVVWSPRRIDYYARTWMRDMGPGAGQGAWVGA